MVVCWADCSVLWTAVMTVVERVALWDAKTVAWKDCLKVDWRAASKVCMKAEC